MIRPERRALLCCARVDLDVASREKLRSIVAGGIDLRRLVREARREGLVPLVCRHVRELVPGGDHHSDTVRDLESEARANVLTSLTAAGELAEVSSALQRLGVCAIAIKGPVSATLCYGDLGLRTFGDLDLLISPSELPAAWSYLEGQGYTPRFALSPASRARLLRSDSQLAFSSADGLRRIDLHWSLLPQGHTFTPGNDGPFARRLVGNTRNPRIRGLELNKRLAIFTSAEDLSTGLVGQAVDGVIGYTPATATDIMLDMILYSTGNARRPSTATAPTTAPTTIPSR